MALPSFFPEITEPTPINAAGFHIFNGDGTGQDIVTVRVGGETILENAHIPFSYTVNADCTGSYTTQVPQGPSPSFGLFIAPDGESIAVITTDQMAIRPLTSLRECHASSTVQGQGGSTRIEPWNSPGEPFQPAHGGGGCWRRAAVEPLWRGLRHRGGQSCFAEAGDMGVIADTG